MKKKLENSSTFAGQIRQKVGLKLLWIEVIFLEFPHGGSHPFIVQYNTIFV